MTDHTFTIVGGPLLDRDMRVMREGFRRAFPVARDLPFDQLLEAIDVADEAGIRIQPVQRA